MSDWERNHISLRLRGMSIAGARALGLVTLGALLGATACGTVAAGHGSLASRHSGGPEMAGLACTTTVRGVVQGPGSLTATWLPRGYRLQAGTQATSSPPGSTYVKATSQPDPPRIMLSSAHQAGPVTGADGGAGRGSAVRIQGHGGLIESGPPAPQLAGVYWKPDPRFLISVVGYKVPRASVLRVAQSVSFAAPGIIALPVAPGRIVTRQAAILAAERSAGSKSVPALAKLSSWTEVAAMAGRGAQALTAPPGLAASPWRPVWVVLLAPSRSAPTVVIVDAVAGQVQLAARLHGRWFTALTDRDPASAGQCTGGSSALLPFGVLTRDEEAYPPGAGPAVPHARLSVHYVLSTVPAVNRADPDIYGGCIQQNCSIDELVWVTITTVRADPGTTVACLPGSVSVPPGYKPRQLTTYYTVSIPDAFAVGCGPLPRRLRNLTDLAPPAPSSAGGR